MPSLILSRSWERVTYARAAEERARLHLVLMLDKLDKLMQPPDPNALAGDPPPECQDEWDFAQAAWEVYQAQLACVAAEQLIALALYDFYQVANTAYLDCVSP